MNHGAVTMKWFGPEVANHLIFRTRKNRRTGYPGAVLRQPKAKVCLILSGSLK